jgi:hypothetical protein
MTISISDLQATWGGGNPASLSSYYQGGPLIGIGVKGGSIPYSGAISLNNFSGAVSSYGYSYNQLTSGDQSNDGCAWAVEYGSNGSGFGLYVTVAYYGNGGGIGYNTFGNYSYVSQFKITSFDSNVYGTVVSGNGNSESYYMGVPYGNINSSSNILTVYGNNGTGSPGDAGYRYATNNNRANWSAMTGGNNYFQIQLG